MHDERSEAARLLLKRLSAALNTCRLYGAHHARTETAVAGLAAVAARGAGPNGALTVEITRTAWRLASEDADRAAEQLAPLLQALYGRGVRALSFGSGVADAELRELLAILDLPIERVRAVGGPAQALRARGVQTITVRGADGALGAPGAGSRSGGASAAPSGAEGILKQFVAAARNVRLYGESHRTVQALIDALFRMLQAALTASETLSYEVRSGTVFSGKAALERDAMIAGTFAADCAARRIDRLTFARGLTRAELEQAVALFARDPEALIVEGGFAEALRARRITHVG